MNQLLSIIISGAFKLLSLIPLKLIDLLAQLVGSLLWLSNSESKKVALQNLRLCFPDATAQECSNIAKRRMKHLTMTALELGAAWSWPEQKMLDHMHIPGDNEQLLDELLAKGKGLILLAPHHGNWEALGNYIGAKHPITCLYQPPKIAVMDELVLERRKRFSSELAPTNAKGVRILLKSLKRGQIVSILPDQVPQASGGEFAPFFGVPALTMTLVYNLIQRTGAPAVVSYAKRVNNGKYFQPVFREVPPALYSPDRQLSLRALNECVERVVLECPEQYQWEYKRFKKQADGKKFYK